STDGVVVGVLVLVLASANELAVAEVCTESLVGSNVESEKAAVGGVGVFVEVIVEVVVVEGVFVEGVFVVVVGVVVFVEGGFVGVFVVVFVGGEFVVWVS